MTQIRFSDERHLVNLEAQTARFEAAFPKASAVLTQVTLGLADTGDDAFATGPKGMVQYILGATPHLGETTEWSHVFKHYALNWVDNPASRVVWTAGNMLWGIAQLATGPESYDVRGVTRWGMSVAMLVAVPEGIKTGKVMARGAARVIPSIDAAFARAEAVAMAQHVAKATLQRILAQDDAAFARAWKNTAPARQMGALEIPQWMVLRSNTHALVDLFQYKASMADLEALCQHADVIVKRAAEQVLAERRNTAIPDGYVQIPGGPFKGQVVSPFAMKATPVTMAEWRALIRDGNPKDFVLLRQDRQTLVTTLEEYGYTRTLVRIREEQSRRVDFERGGFYIESTPTDNLILVQLVSQPNGPFNNVDMYPVANITHFHAEAWLKLQTEKSGGTRVYRLPTDLEFEFVASNGGRFKFGTETGELYAADGRKLAHFDDRSLVAVDDPRYLQALPFGVQTTGNIRYWTAVNPKEAHPYGARGWSGFFKDPSKLQADFRDSFDPHYHFNNFDLGFSAVVTPAPTMK
jgi:formylglycine-generating enzyme required for sulfatase activity